MPYSKTTSPIKSMEKHNERKRKTEKEKVRERERKKEIAKISNMRNNFSGYLQLYSLISSCAYKINSF